MSHPYGPHDETTAPNVVVVKVAGRYFGNPRISGDQVYALPAALVRQREQINRAAHRAWQELPETDDAGV